MDASVALEQLLFRRRELFFSDYPSILEVTLWFASGIEVQEQPGRWLSGACELVTIIRILPCERLYILVPGAGLEPTHPFG